MPAVTSLSDARTLFGPSLLSPDEVARALRTESSMLAGADVRLLADVPYDADTLRAARARGEFLVFRVSRDATGPLTILRLLERFPGGIQAKLLKGVGYQLKDEWTLDREPFAYQDTCALEWRLVGAEPIATTCNLTYELQTEALARYAVSVGLDGRLRRRRAVEIVYDVLLFHQVRGVRLLERTWDWSETPTSDGGYATVGQFATEGLSVIGYSRAVRFGTLGICGQH